MKCPFKKIVTVDTDDRIGRTVTKEELGPCDGFDCAACKSHTDIYGRRIFNGCKLMEMKKND